MTILFDASRSARAGRRPFAYGLFGPPDEPPDPHATGPLPRPTAGGHPPPLGRPAASRPDLGGPPRHVGVPDRHAARVSTVTPVAGLISRGLAEAIARGSLVGHPN